jgi:hypothetical protein
MGLWASILAEGGMPVELAMHRSPWGVDLEKRGRAAEDLVMTRDDQSVPTTSVAAAALRCRVQGINCTLHVPTV